MPSLLRRDITSQASPFRPWTTYPIENNLKMILPMPLKVQEFTSDYCTILFQDHLLLRYTAAAAVPRIQSPKSYFHPLYTLKGSIVTDFAPSDHPWHHGIAFAPTYINNDTFWGGPSFTSETLNYEWLNNQGHQEHIGWEITTSNPERIAWTQRVAWRNHQEVRWMEEERRIQVDIPRATVNLWRLSLEFVLHNVFEQELVFASPVCRGRPEGGYFGLMWRGDPSFAQGHVFTAEKKESANLMGTRAPWLAYVAPSVGASLLFLDNPKNPRYPTPWFVRCGKEPLVSYALAYHEPYTIASGESLALRYQLLIADEIWTRDDASAVAAGAMRDSASSLANKGEAGALGGCTTISQDGEVFLKNLVTK